MEMLSWLLFIILIGALILVGGLLLRGYLSTGSAMGALQSSIFKPKPEKRLDLMEQYNLDGRRKLLLIRRDGVEHLIMTGGPVDVVIETGIGEPVHTPVAKKVRANGEAVETPAGAVYQRPARALGQSAGEGSN
jgi:hypothetical protein